MESLPFLMGSGGTLIFDVMIMCQAVLYRKSGHKSIPSSSRRSKRRNVDLDEAEEAALLADTEDIEAGPGSRSQSRSVSRSRPRRARGERKSGDTRQSARPTSISRTWSGRSLSQSTELALAANREIDGDMSGEATPRASQL